MPQFDRTTLLDAALTVAHGKHYTQMTREDVAAQAECAPALISYYLGRMCEVRDAVVDLARKRGCLRLLHAAPVGGSRNSGRNGPVRSNG